MVDSFCLALGLREENADGHLMPCKTPYNPIFLTIYVLEHPSHRLTVIVHADIVGSTAAFGDSQRPWLTTTVLPVKLEVMRWLRKLLDSPTALHLGTVSNYL